MQLDMEREPTAELKRDRNLSKQQHNRLQTQTKTLDCFWTWV